MNVGVITALVAAGVSVLGGLMTLLTLGAQRRKLTAEGAKTKADYVKVLSETAISLLAPMEAQAAVLKSQLKAANSEIADLRSSLDAANRSLDETNLKVITLNERLTMLDRWSREVGVPLPPWER